MNLCLAHICTSCTVCSLFSLPQHVMTDQSPDRPGAPSIALGALPGHIQGSTGESTEAVRSTQASSTQQQHRRLPCRAAAAAGSKEAGAWWGQGSSESICNCCCWKVRQQQERPQTHAALTIEACRCCQRACAPVFTIALCRVCFSAAGRPCHYSKAARRSEEGGMLAPKRAAVLAHLMRAMRS